MTPEEKKAWEELVEDAKQKVINDDCCVAAEVAKNRVRPLIAADTIIKRAGDVKLIHAFICGEIDDPFIAYQEAKISKGKLCDIIARSLSEWFLGE